MCATRCARSSGSTRSAARSTRPPAPPTNSATSARSQPMSTSSPSISRFRALHEGEPFVIPNPWDGGSARMLEELGFKALATTSSGFAFTLGRADGDVTLDEVIAHTALLANAVWIPVAVDLENGYGRGADDAAR